MGRPPEDERIYKVRYRSNGRPYTDYKGSLDAIKKLQARPGITIIWVGEYKLARVVAERKST
jgi:hypothetical protein